MEKYVGACGCICSECRAYKKSCEGCYAIEGKAMWLSEVNLEVCDFYECAVIDKKLKHCGDCSLIPCDKFFKNKNPKWTYEMHQKLVRERTILLKSL